MSGANPTFFFIFTEPMPLIGARRISHNVIRNICFRFAPIRLPSAGPMPLIGHSAIPLSHYRINFRPLPIGIRRRRTWRRAETIMSALVASSGGVFPFYFCEQSVFLACHRVELADRRQ